MPTDEELMQQALDALEHCAPHQDLKNPYFVIEALRARLTQPEPVHANNTSQERVQKTEKNEHEPVAWTDAPKLIYLQVCEDDVCEVPFGEHNEVSWCQDKINDSDIPYIRADTAPPQREQGCAECNRLASDGWALYCVKCSEPLREWQGLTEHDFGLWKEHAIGILRWADAVLKERNS